MAFGWEGKLVRLVPLDIDKHFENAVRWLNDPVVTEHLLVGDFPMGALEEREYFEKHMRGSRDDIALAIETLDGTHLGFSGIHGISWRHGFATTGTVLGVCGEWGKGYGTDAARVRGRYAFDVLGLRILYSSILDGNERSYRMQMRTGYKECGRFPQRYWKRGAFRDELRTFLTPENLTGS